MKLELAVAQLSIADGVWQENPDHIARFYEFTLFGEGVARGHLYIVTEVFGDPEGRDELAREMIETVRREYAASRGSISASLAGAIRVANEAFFETNAALPAEARRIAGMTAAVLRDHELFIAQAGPGVVCLVRENTVHRFPETSPWFNAAERPLYDDEFLTPGTVPLGKRRVYVPDLFHITLQPGDTVALATRTLVHLLSQEELVDTFAHRHPDEIVKSLEELAGAADLSLIILHVLGQITIPNPESPTTISAPPIPEPAPQPGSAPPAAVPVEEPPLPSVAEPSEEALLRQRERAEKARALQTQWRATFLKIVAGVVAGLAALLGRFNATTIGTTIDRFLAGLGRGIARVSVFLIRAIVPDVSTERAERPVAWRSHTAWQLASLVLPVLLIVMGVSAWVMYRVEQQRVIALEVDHLVDVATRSLQRAEQLADTDKHAAREAAQQAFDAAQQARAKRPSDPRVSQVYYAARDMSDRLNGIAILYPQAFFALTEARAHPTRIVASYPNLFVLDRGLSRVYRFTVTEAGASPAATASPDGVILQAGERVGERTVGPLIDLAIVDSKRLVALDRTGSFLVYDMEHATWSARVALDAAAWSRVTVVASYANNVYLLDAPNHQILKYVPNADGWWTAATTFFNPGANPNTANMVDMAIDGEVWLLRNTGALVQCSAARCNEIVIRDLEIPLSKPVAVFTTQALTALYIADAGNRRLVQIDKSTGRFARQFKPSAQHADTFTALQAFTADDRKFYFINQNTAYLATIPASP